jgi:hypothetical protein
MSLVIAERLIFWVHYFSSEFSFPRKILGSTPKKLMEREPLTEISLNKSARNWKKFSQLNSVPGMIINTRNTWKSFIAFIILVYLIANCVGKKFQHPVISHFISVITETYLRRRSGKSDIMMLGIPLLHLVLEVDILLLSNLTMLVTWQIILKYVKKSPLFRTSPRFQYLILILKSFAHEIIEFIWCTKEVPFTKLLTIPFSPVLDILIPNRFFIL